MRTISVFENARKNTPSGQTFLSIIEDDIKNGVYKNQVEAIRQTTDKKERTRLKLLLPSFTVSGEFIQRKKEGLKQHSHFYILDFDKVQDVEGLKKLLMSYDGVTCAFRSPSGNGVKGVFSAVHHKGLDSQTKHGIVWQYIEETFGALEGFDRSGKDVCRLCFYSYDDKLLKNKRANIDLTEYQPQHPALQIAAKLINESFNGNKHASLLKASNLLGGYVKSGEITWNRAYEVLKETISKQDIDDLILANKTIQDGLQHGAKTPLQTKAKEKAKEFKNVFVGSTMQELMEQELKPLQSIYDVLMYDNDLCILFADSNVGKSIFAVQIAVEMLNPFHNCLRHTLSEKSGKVVDNFIEPVILLDFEMSDRQFQHRYKNTDTGEKYVFPENLFRYKIDVNSIDEESPVDCIIDSLEKLIEEKKPKLVIIDNITYLQAEGGVTSKEANVIMKRLKAIKEKTNTTILVIAHTPKRYDTSKPLSMNDVAGSANFTRFADSIIGLNASTLGENKCYIKQVKTRSEEKLYSTMVISCNRVKEDNGYLHLVYDGIDEEWKHLSEPKEAEKQKKEMDIQELSKSGKSQRYIAKQMGVSLGTVNAILSKTAIQE